MRITNTRQFDVKLHHSITYRPIPSIETTSCLGLYESEYTRGMYLVASTYGGDATESQVWYHGPDLNKATQEFNSIAQTALRKG